MRQVLVIEWKLQVVFKVINVANTAMALTGFQKIIQQTVTE